MADYDEKEDLMDRLMALGRRKKGLTLDQLHRELPENMLSADDMEDVLERLEGANISVAETDAQLLERASTLALDDEEEEKEVDEDDLDLDLSAGVLDKSNDPVRLYLREMGIVPLLNREGEVTIAKRTVGSNREIRQKREKKILPFFVSLACFAVTIFCSNFRRIADDKPGNYSSP